ncbi:MAG: hypothetical protein J6B06_04765 [Lachnospiraceae bacterium]|nr:hypothetical protein [Lachnospiraceae bacterium]
MPVKKVYTIKQNRLKQAALTGIRLENGRLVCTGETAGRSIFLGALDSGEDGTGWGRLSFTGEFSENMVYVTHILALDHQEFMKNGEQVKVSQFLLDKEEKVVYKKLFFEKADEIKFINQKDMLLYELKGRYLWIFIEILGEGTGYLEHIRVNIPGDNFMATFPEIYREEGGFFHRYLSIFSSIYNDFQEDIDTIASKLDIDTAPPELLPVFASWLGVELAADILPQEKLRVFLKEAYQLCKYKGTSYALSRITDIVLGVEPVIIENNDLCVDEETKKLYESMYGSSSYDITVLVNVDASESEHSHLLQLLNQFKPVRARLNLVFLKKEGRLDSYCYLDKNAQIGIWEEGVLDQGQNMEGTIILQ